jgi:ABC-type polysaccharide/polyol phosphate export permease
VRTGQPVLSIRKKKLRFNPMNKLSKRLSVLFTRANGAILIESIRAEFKAYGHNSLLGMFWSLLSPLAMLSITYFIFRTYFGGSIKAYPFYILLGLVCVDFFVIATTYAMRNLYINREFILNVNVPREIITSISLSLHVHKFIIELILCAVLSIIYGFFRWQSFVLLLPLVTCFILLVLGLGLILSLLFCFTRDTEYVWIIVARMFFFATPVFYGLDSLSSLLRKIVYFGNPITPFLISFRAIFMGAPPGASYAYSLFLGVCVFILSFIVFVCFENRAVERV